MKTVQDDADWEALKEAGRTGGKPGTQTYLTPTPVTVGEESDPDEVTCLDDLR